MITLIFSMMLAQAESSDGLRREAQPALTTTVSMVMPTGSMTLARLIEAAGERNVDHRITVEQLRKSETEVSQAWSALLPFVSVQAAWVHNQYAAEIPPGPISPTGLTIVPEDQLDLVARVDLPLIDTTRWMRTSAAEAARDAWTAREQLTADQVKRAVATSWYQYGAAIALRSSAERSVGAAEAQYKLQEIRRRAGSATELEVLRAESEVERNKQSVADADRLIAVARRALWTLSGLDPGPAAALPEADLRPARSLEELEAGLDQLPAVRAAEHELRAVEKLATASELALVPQVNAQFTERITNAGGFTGQNASYNFGVSLAWRLDAPMLYGMDVQAHNVAITTLSLEKVRLQVRDQLNADWQTLRAALTKTRSAKAQVQAAQRAREVATTRYQVGASTQLDVIQSDRDLFAAEVQLIQAQTDVASARVAVQLSAGLPLEMP